MSLKAKIEAVIYASEDPVTLAQLVSLLGQEAQAELDSLAAQQDSLPLDEEPATAADPDALNAEALGEGATTAEAAAAGEPTSAEMSAVGAPEVAVSAPEDAEDKAAEAAAEAEPPAVSPAGVDAVVQAAAARARERRLRDYFRSLLDQLIADYANSDRGLEIREVAGGFRLATKPEYHDAVRGFVKSLKPPLKLSLQALETLAVVAYKQPVTAPEVSEIRGVDSGGVLASLMARKLITTAGRKQVIGRPILYKTTKDFLVRFGLKDLNELPSIEEFERMAGELAEAVQEEIPMPAADESAVRRSEEDPSAIENIHEGQPDGEPYSDEGLSEENPADSVVPPADNVEVDGRLSGVPPNYNRGDENEIDEVDTPALDAEVQSGEKDNGA
jgi:segregation and condensation protein B